MTFGNPLETWGLAGFFIFVLAGVVAYLFRLLLREKDARFNDSLETKNKVVETMDSLSRTVSLIYDKLRDGGK